MPLRWVSFLTNKSGTAEVICTFVSCDNQQEMKVFLLSLAYINHKKREVKKNEIIIFNTWMS